MLRSQPSLNIILSDPKINNLEKVLLCIRRNTDCGDSALYDKFAFRNGSDIECAKQSSNVGGAATWAQLTTVGTSYNGLKYVKCRYLSEPVPTEIPVLIKPYHFRHIKQLTSSCFEDSDPRYIKEYEYDGIADKGLSDSNSVCPGAWLNSNTQFIIGLDFRAGPKGALNSGISLSRSNLEIELDMVDNGTARTTDYTVDYYMISGSMLHVYTSGIVLRYIRFNVA